MLNQVEQDIKNKELEIKAKQEELRALKESLFKKCPFCNGQPEGLRSRSYVNYNDKRSDPHQVLCTCGASMDGGSYKDAQTKWNKRGGDNE